MKINFTQLLCKHILHLHDTFQDMKQVSRLPDGH